MIFTSYNEIISIRRKIVNLFRTFSIYKGSNIGKKIGNTCLSFMIFLRQSSLLLVNEFDPVYAKNHPGVLYKLFFRPFNSLREWIFKGR